MSLKDWHISGFLLHEMKFTFDILPNFYLLMSNEVKEPRGTYVKVMKPMNRVKKVKLLKLLIKLEKYNCE